METPKGKQVKMTKLGEPRWRLSAGDHEIFIEKTGQNETRLEHQNGDEIGTYPAWSPAMRDALRIFDRWDDASKPLHETVDEAAEEAEMQMMLQDMLEKMVPLEERLEPLATQVLDEALRATITATEWKIVRQALNFTKSMLRHHDLQQIRLEKRR